MKRGLGNIRWQIRAALRPAATPQDAPPSGDTTRQQTEGVEQSISIAEFIRAIKKLPPDPPLVRQGIWYTTQKQHWLGWLSQYDGPGAYGRKTGGTHDAKFAYNHIVCPEMLLWITKAAGVDPELVAAARAAADEKPSLPGKAGVIRRCVPWRVLYKALFASSR